MLKGGREGVSGEREGGTECVTEMREEGRDGVRKEWGGWTGEDTNNTSNNNKILTTKLIQHDDTTATIT